MSEYNFKIIYQSETKNAKTDAFIDRIDDFFTTAENDKFKYQYQTILICFRLKIFNMNADEKVFIYERIQTINKVDKKCKYFRRVIYEKRKFFNRIQLNQCSFENEVLFHQK